MNNGTPRKPDQQVLGPETNALMKRVNQRNRGPSKKTFLKGLEQATRVLYEEKYLSSDDVHRLALGAFVKVLTDKDHVNWRYAMREYMDRVYGKVTDKVEHTIDKQLLEEIRLVPVRGKIAELPLLDEKKDPEAEEGQPGVQEQESVETLRKTDSLPQARGEVEQGPALAHHHGKGSGDDDNGEQGFTD